MYTFEKVDFEEVARASKGMHITSVELFDSKEYINEIGKYINSKGDHHFALLFGKYQALFGAPNHISKDNDYLYIYCLKATAKDGSFVYLCPYHGDRGAAVLMPSELNDVDTKPYYVALGVLAALLIKTQPLDYKWKFHTRWKSKKFMTYEVICGEAFVSSIYANKISEEEKKGYY